MSKLEVNTLAPQTGTTITIGESGDTVALGSGATQSGFGGVNTPAFKADFTSSPSIPSSSATVVAFNNELLDTNSCYNTSTYRFIPNEAGWYFIHALIRFPTATDFDNSQFIIQ